MSRLTLRGLGKRYAGTVVLDGIDLDVSEGSRTAIVGPSGCGKTTLLRLIAGFEAPDLGRIALDQQVLAEGAMAIPAHKRGIGIVMQDGALFPHLSIADNIAFGLSRSGPDRQAAVAALSDLVDLPRAALDLRPDQLSGGQQQRVALARALAREPRLLLLDEPFSALDAGLRAATRDAMAELLTRRGVTTILVTHDQEEALSFADQVAVMLEGRIGGAGSPRELYFRPRHERVATFLGDAILLDADMVDRRAACPLGLIAVDAPERSGAVRLMLRPEQISVVPQGTVGAAQGRMLATRFRGATTAVLVALDAWPALPPLGFAIPTIDAPSSGDTITLAVASPAHVLDP